VAKGRAPAGHILAHCTGSTSTTGREVGAALIMALAVLVLLGSVVLIEGVRIATSSGLEREVNTVRGLAEAKSALIAWSITASATAGRNITPGLLPFPDRNRDGNYDGKGDCVTFGLNATHLLGRLPWAGSVPPCPRLGLGVDYRDGGGERLWYAVSRNLVTRGGGGSVNPDMLTPGTMTHPWIAVRDMHGNLIRDPGDGMPLPVAAVIIAPGPALGAQDRGSAAPAAWNYLDALTLGATTFDNSDADGCPDAHASPCASASHGEEFIAHPVTGADGVFNDRLIAIGAHELMRALEKRVLGEVAVALNSYQRTHGVYPWLARFDDPRTTAFEDDGERAGLLPAHFLDELPEWFGDNDWHRFIYVAMSSDAVAGGNVDGDDDCRTPVNTCLRLKVDGVVVRDDVRVLVISAGAAMRDQDRAIGDCDGDGVGDGFLCAYFEGDNADRSTAEAADTYARGRLGVRFNDQVRIVAPLPP